jgi:hypothetical protein
VNEEGRSHPWRKPADAGTGLVGAAVANGQGGWRVRGLTRWRASVDEGQKGEVWLAPALGQWHNAQGGKARDRGGPGKMM